MDPRGRRRWRVLAVGGVIALLLLVWTAAGLAGLLVSGSWPDVSLLGSIVELVRVAGGGGPAVGVPRAVFWLCLLLELGAAARLGVQVRRWRGEAPQRSWSPRPVAGEPVGAVSFETAYAQAVRNDRRPW
jgi:hypothetical protein